MGGWVASALSDKLNTKVTVSRVDLGFLNRILVDDINIDDQQGKKLLHVPRASVSFKLPSILQGKFSIQTAQIFGLKANLYRETPASSPNYQFIIDAFSSENDEESQPLSFQIQTLIIRRANICYDILSEDLKKDTFDINHLDIKDFGLTATIRAFSNDSLNIAVKRLNFKESNSGFSLTNLYTSFVASQQTALIDSLYVETPQSYLSLGTSKIQKEGEDNSRWAAETRLEGTITPADFHCFLPATEAFHTPLRVESDISLTSNSANLTGTSIQTDDGSIDIAIDAQIRQLDTASPQFVTRLHHADLRNDAIEQLLQTLPKDNPAVNIVRNLGNIHADGDVTRNEEGYQTQLQIHTSQGGDLAIDGMLTNDQALMAHIQSDGLDLARLTGNHQLGNTVFNLDIDGIIPREGQPEGIIRGTIDAFEYAGYTYSNISLDGNAGARKYEGWISIDDENIQLFFDGKLDTSSTIPVTDMQLSVKNFNPHALNLTSNYQNEQFNFHARANTIGNSFRTATGVIDVDSILIRTPEQLLTLDRFTLQASKSDKTLQHITMNSDFIHAVFDGNVSLFDIVPSFQKQLSHHLSALIRQSSTERTHDTQFDFSIELKESPLVHHFVDLDYALLQPVRMTGTLNSSEEMSSITVDAPCVSYNGTEYRNVNVNYSNNSSLATAVISLMRSQNERFTSFNINADAHDNLLQTTLEWSQLQEGKTHGNIHAAANFSQADGRLLTNVNLLSSQLHINDTIWHVAPANIRINGKRIECNNVKIYNDNRYIKINGIISESPIEFITAELNDIQVEYVVDLVNFTAVKFKGRAFGQAHISNIFDTPDINANIRVDDLCLSQGRLGTAQIGAYWDKSIEGIRVQAHIVDKDKDDKEHITDCNGFISPAKNDIMLKVDTHDTSVSFLNGILGSVFKDMQGNANGTLNIMGPLNDINLVGDISTDVSMRLKATNVRYHINPADTIHFRKYRFGFENIHIADDQNNSGIVNGFVSHKNMKNFAYELQVDMNHLMAYDEKQFNSDKFMGTVFADGTLIVKGADRHPLNITADVTPTRGSVFAYDAATPDAIASSSFITFRDRSAVNNPQFFLSSSESADNPYQYHGDIFMDISIHLNPECEIKLRMDNVDDGYISTFGTGTLQAHYHNKGPFTLNGTYNIQNGRYRLYLQDIIYRDLAIQDGSNVVFNGNPFDANIHLICWHTLNSVPLADLTANSAYNSSNKVKVICILDITGKLGNMNFQFDINLPNVTDETRQLVRSLISTEEEMNMQMIYLLGLGRFYANEYMRAANENNSSSAVNTLLSSTISGQINQMLSNLIGTDSKWNFGTGLSTGERGWNDLDVEGILSGRLLDDRLLINGNFGYRDNALTQNGSFIGDFDLKWRITPNGNTYLKAYNQTNDRYFTKATLNTQGIGISYQRNFDSWRQLFRLKMRDEDLQ